MMKISPLSLADVEQLMQVQRLCYSDDLVESASLMTSRLTAFPDTCWGYFVERQMAGYLLAYPSIIGRISALSAPFPDYNNCDCLYLHDMAISSEFRGRSLASALLDFAKQQAKHQGLSVLALVAVQGAEIFWLKHGFQIEPDVDKQQQAVLDSYLPETAYYMTCRLSD